MKCRPTTALLWLALALSARAQTANQAPPTFPRGVDVVTVDVVVTDKAGNPVSGLTKDDFTVLDEGRPQPISSFESIRVPVPGRLRPPPSGHGPASPPTRRYPARLAACRWSCSTTST
jgi:hypothetical protein